MRRVRAVVAGGTGLVGHALLRALVADPAWTSVASVARRAPATPIEGVELRALDDVPEADVAFCALGTTIRAAGSQAAFRAVDHGLVLRFARDAKTRGATRFHVVSALGADAGSRVFYNRVKGEMERDVRALGFAGACAYRPSLLLGERDEARPGERAGIAIMRTLAPIVPRRFAGIPPEVVAQAMAAHAKAMPSGWHEHESGELWALAG